MENIIRQYLVNAGFDSTSIDHFCYLLSNGSTFNTRELRMYGYDDMDINNLKMMYKLSRKCIDNLNKNSDIINNINNFKVYLASVGFGLTEIEHFEMLVMSGRGFTANELLPLGYGQQDIKRLRYMYDLCTSKKVLDTKEKKIKHLKSISNVYEHINLDTLPESTIKDVPRLALVAGIKQEPYSIWNSNNYSGINKFYVVKDKTGSNIEVETSKRPQLKYKAAKEIPGVLEIVGVKQNGKVVVKFNKNVCRLCNRYIIVASVKTPKCHLGAYEIICSEGTRVYVYALNIKDNNLGGIYDKRVYSYGIFPGDIKGKLTEVAKYLYKHLSGVESSYIDANDSFDILTIQRREDEEDEQSEVEF